MIGFNNNPDQRLIVPSVGEVYNTYKESLKRPQKNRSQARSKEDFLLIFDEACKEVRQNGT